MVHLRAGADPIAGHPVPPPIRWGALLAVAAAAVAVFAADPARRELLVTATAYNSLPGQTWGDPEEAAWGDRLEPGMRAVAVSRDLVRMGLTRGVEVRIEGLPGTFVVLDKMARRWRRRIDIYMGTDREAAREWGRRQVRISWSSADSRR